MPNMLPTHMRLIEKTLILHGYNMVMLETDNDNIVNEGLKNVHNDTCYPALLVIGQLLDAIKTGDFDVNKTALIITQTGGGCRASNYIHLLRKALKQSGLGHIPVISLNISGLEKNPGFKLTLSLTVQLIYAVVYADMLMWLANQTRPYEVDKGETDKLVEYWENRLSKEYQKAVNLRIKKIKSNLIEITEGFAKIKKRSEKKIRVGKRIIESGKLANYALAAPDFVSHIQNGKNYGIVNGTGEGLTTLDADNLPRLQELGIIAKLPITMTAGRRREDGGKTVNPSQIGVISIFGAI